MDLRCFKALPVRCKSFSLRFQAGSNPTLSASFLLMSIDLRDGLTSTDVH
jgi:hypothetical protein